MTCSPSEAKQKHAAWIDNAIANIRKDLSNVILKDIKKQIAIHSGFTAFVTALLDQYNSHHVEDDQIDHFYKSQVYDNSIITDDTSLYKDKKYLEKSANDGNQFAQYQLGKIYYSPDLGKTDYSLAISYLEASAAQGNDFAMYRLAVLYKNSDLEFYAIGKAIDYFKSSAELANQFAQYQLGRIFSSPDYGEPDYPLAISYLNDSAAQEKDSAMYQLGRMYSNEDIPIYNMDLAVSYLMKSANKNNSFAQLQLGMIYLWGMGVKQNVYLGKAILTQAIKNENPFAQQVLDSYETYRLQYTMNISYKLFTNIYEAISNQDNRASTIAAERLYRNLSKKAMIEEQLKKPHKHSNSHESEK